MSKLKALAGQTAIYGLSTIIGRLLNYFLVPFYTHLIFEPAAYGVVTELYSYMTFLLVLYTIGMETAFFYFNINENAQKVYNNAFTALLVNALVLSGLIALLTPWLADVLHYPQHREYFYYIALIMGLDAVVAIPFARLRQQGKAWRFATVKLLNIGLNVAFNLFFFLLCPWLLGQDVLVGFVEAVWSPEIGVGYVFISNLLASAFTVLFLLPQIAEVRFQIDMQLLKRMLKYASPLIIVGLAGMVNEVIDRVLLKFLLPGPLEWRMAQVGIYGANYKLSIFMTLAIQSFRFAAEPFFFAQQKEKDAPQTYASVLLYFTFLGGLIFLGVSLFLDVFGLIIGEEYREGLFIVPILLLANLFLGIFYNLSIWYKVKEKNRVGAVITVIGALITLSLNWMLIPLFSYVGAAWTTLATYFFMAIVSYVLGQRYYPVPYRVGRISLYIAAAVLLYLLATWLKADVLPLKTDWQPLALLVNVVAVGLYALLFIRLEKLRLSYLRSGR